MDRDYPVEVEILRREVSHLREQLADYKSSALNMPILLRENTELRRREMWLEQRIIALEFAARAL